MNCPSPRRSSSRLVYAIPIALLLALPASVFAVVGTCESLPGGVIEVEGTGGSGTQPTGYATLGAAFTAINTGVHTGGTIAIDVCGDTAEGTATATLNASGSGAALYTAITISPVGGAARTISGATTAGSPMIDFSGADSVTIDGLNTGGNALTISNTTVSATSGTSTIRFIGGATGNTITNSTILGAGTMSVATNGATIFFSTDAVTANGNDNNTISNNSIGPVGASLPTKAILGNGSTSTTAIGNSGIVINNNNIFDYFGAAVTSSGVATNGGCNAWTITNNRFYQTGTRTWTTGATHRAIDINNSTATSGAQGFTITGNIIGYASNAQTGTYTLTGSTGKFQGIQYNGITGGVLSNINSNTIAAVSMTGVTSSGTSTSSPFAAVLVTNGLATTSSNTIGSQGATGSLTFSTTTTTSTDAYGIYNFSSDDWTANSNSIGGISVTNLGASGTFVVYGMRANTSTTKLFNASSNNLGGTVAGSIQLTSTGASSQVIGMFSSNAGATWTSNTVRNLTNNNGTGTTTAASVIGMASTTTTPNHTLTQNTIYGLSNSNTTVGTVVTGIQFTGGTANVVARNLIYGLTTASNSTAAEVNGIRVAGGTTVYRNNMIAVGAGITNAIGTGSTTGGVNGINEPLGTDSFFHNSVYVGGAPTAGVGPSYAFNSSQTTNTRSFRDNIFVNARNNSGATGKNYVVRVGGTAANPAGLTINNNLYSSSGAGAVFGFFNSLDVADLPAWRVAVGQDAVSFASDPQYLDPTNATPDLHLHPTNPTVAEGNGFDVGVTDDYDGQTRSGLTPVDIGADAGNFAGIDLAPPVISYTALGNTTSTANRPLTATITDVGSGVPTAGVGLPVIYFRKGVAGAFASTQASSGGGGTYNFTIDYSLVTGGSVAIGDTIQYYVVAQDGAATPNVTSSPAAGASGYTANPPAAATPPTTPNSYLISAPITGIKTVCASGCDYTTLTGAAGIFAAINTNVLTGNVEIQIAGDLVVGEDGTAGLNSLSEEPPGSNYTVKIYPTGVARAITGAFNGALIRLAGASRVTIDGSVGGTGTDRSLTIQNTSVTTPSVVLIGSTGTMPVINDALRNCVIINGVNTSSAVVISDSTTLGNAGYFSNIAIQNNDIQKAYIGVYANGGTTPQNGASLTYSQNSLNTVGANAIRLVGLYMQGVNGATVSQNTLGNFSNSEGENDIGIWLATGTGNAVVSGNTVTNLGMTLTTGFAPYGIRESSGLTASGSTISGNTVSNLSTTGSTAVRGIAASGGGVTVERNQIQGIINNNTSTFGSFGIDVTAGNNDVIKNNFVSDVNHNMTGGAAFGPDFGVVGIRLGAGTGHKVYANSVNLFGPHTGTATTSLLSAAFSISATTQTGIDVRDNIFANNITGGTTSIAHVAVYLPSGGTSAMNLTWNNNAYFYGADALTQGVGQAGTTAGTNFYTTLPALAAYSSTLSGAGTNDNASLASTGAVPFTSASDLHLLPGSPMLQLGVTLSGVTDDIDGDARPAAAPDLGADEIVQNADLSITKTDGVTSVVQGGTTTYTITASNAGPSAATGSLVTDTFPAACTSVSWTCTPAGGATCTASGSGNISDTVNLPVGGSAVYTAACSVSPSATGSLANTATVAAPAGITDPTPGNNSATDTDSILVLADLSITKTDGVTSASPGGSVIYTISVANAGPNADPAASVVDTFPVACTSVSYTSVASGGATGNTASGAGNIADTLSLPVGGGVIYTATCNISGSASGSLSNTATVTGSLSDPNLADNSATDIDGLGAVADVSITKTDGSATEVPGTPVTYTITATNAGPSPAPSVTIADTFAGTLSGCSTTCVGSGGGTCAAGPVSGNLSDTANLPSGGSVVYTATCNIASNATGTLDNTATATVGGSVTDPTPGNNSATDSDTLSGSADVSITKTDGSATEVPGTPVTYTIVASNAGPSAASSVTVADTFAATLSGCSTTCVPAGGATCAAGPVSGNLNDTANLPVGGSATYTATCNIAANATGTLANTATAAVGGGASDPTPGNNSATDTDTLNASADVSITKTDGSASEVPGTPVTYTITVSNAGPSAASSVTVADTFAATLSGCSTTCVASGGATCAAGPVSGNLNDTASVPVGGSAVYTATCNIAANATGTLANTATATVGGGASDPASGNNSATDTDTLGASADLSITKTDGVTTATAGGSVTYTIVASNAGPSNAPSSVVTDTFPSSLTCSTTCSGSGGGTCTAGPFSTNINDTVNLPSGASVTYTSVCTVAVNATGSIRNTATVATGSGVTDPTPSNNSATDEDVIPGTALFSDGFETGNTSRWGGAQTLFHAYQVLSVSGSTIEAGYDLAGLPGFAFESSAIAEVAGEGGQAMFRLVARRTDANAAVELSLEVVGGGSSAWVAASGSQLRFDWTAGSAGHVALAIDGRLALWVDGFATSAAPATLELRRSE